MARLSDRFRSSVDATRSTSDAAGPNPSAASDEPRSTPHAEVYRVSPRPNQPFSHGLVNLQGLEEMKLAQIASLHLRGHSVVEIAGEMNQTKAQIQAGLDKLRGRWASVSLMDIDAAVAVTLEEIEQLKTEYMEAWLRSIGSEVVMRGMRMVSAGDAAFLDGVMKCIDRKCKLLGLDSPIKIDITAQVRAMAIAAGLDPDAAVVEAQLVIEEAKRNALTHA